MSKPSKAAMATAEKIFHKEGYISTPETPIANEFRQKRITEVAMMIDECNRELVEAATSLVYAQHNFRQAQNRFGSAGEFERILKEKVGLTCDALTNHQPQQ